MSAARSILAAALLSACQPTEPGGRSSELRLAQTFPSLSLPSGGGAHFATGSVRKQVPRIRGGQSLSVFQVDAPVDGFLSVVLDGNANASCTEGRSCTPELSICLRAQSGFVEDICNRYVFPRSDRSSDGGGLSGTVQLPVAVELDGFIHVQVPAGTHAFVATLGESRQGSFSLEALVTFSSEGLNIR